MTLSRRALLTGVVAASCARAAEPGLGAIAAAAGLRFGSDSDVEITLAPPQYAAALAQHCTLFAPNLGWRRLAAEPAWEDPNLRFASQHGMQLTGAHFLWHESLPPFFSALDATAARDAASSHIRSTAARYAGQVFSWNVVNEAIDTENDNNYQLVTCEPGRI